MYQDKESPLEFQLTRLMRGVTYRKYRQELEAMISTHTPHARRDHLINA